MVSFQTLFLAALDFLRIKAAPCELRYLKYVVREGGEVEVMSPLRGWSTQVYSRLTGLQTTPEHHHSQTNHHTVFMRGWLPGLINPEVQSQSLE